MPAGPQGPSWADRLATGLRDAIATAPVERADVAAVALAAPVLLVTALLCDEVTRPLVTGPDPDAESAATDAALQGRELQQLLRETVERVHGAKTASVKALWIVVALVAVLPLVAESLPPSPSASAQRPAPDLGWGDWFASGWGALPGAAAAASVSEWWSRHVDVWLRALTAGAAVAAAFLLSVSMHGDERDLNESSHRKVSARLLQLHAAAAVLRDE